MSDTCSSWRSFVSHVRLRVQWVGAVFDASFFKYIWRCGAFAQRKEIADVLRQALWARRCGALARKHSVSVCICVKIQFAEASAVVRSRTEIQSLCAFACGGSVCKSDRCGALLLLVRFARVTPNNYSFVVGAGFSDTRRHLARRQEITACSPHAAMYFRARFSRVSTRNL